MDFILEKAFSENDKPVMLLKIQEPSYEVNVWLFHPEIEMLDKALSTRWKDGAIKAGKSANSAVFWCSDSIEKTVSLMIGNDDETWDICIDLSQDNFIKILNELKKT